MATPTELENRSNHRMTSKIGGWLYVLINIMNCALEGHANIILKKSKDGIIEESMCT